MVFIQLHNISYAYEDSQIDLLSNISFDIASSDLVAIIGDNGCGKSTLARLIMGELTPTTGNISYPHSASRIGYLSQLHNFTHPTLINELSGGEKTRLALLKLMLQDMDLIILDEPTNHLDIRSREILEEALLSYPCTLVFVSHDKYFIEKIKTLELFFA